MCTLTNATAAAAQPALQLTVAPLHEGLGPPPISPPDAMTQRQRHLSLAWEVLVPYLRSKVMSLKLHAKGVYGGCTHAQ